jgi:AcrR family transcriptional regulator
MSFERDEARLAVARNAAKLFLERGVAGTSGDDIAAASGLSKRTVWRYFRTKESCVEPLFIESALRFAKALQKWPLDQSIDDFLESAMRVDQQTPQMIADDILAVRLIALSSTEPDLRGVWLYACHLLEQELHAVVSRRANRSVLDFDVRLCAATIVAAIRVVDESISNAAINEHQKFTHAEAVGRVANAIRAASTLPICDPILIDNYR